MFALLPWVFRLQTRASRVLSREDLSRQAQGVVREVAENGDSDSDSTMMCHENPWTDLETDFHISRQALTVAGALFQHGHVEPDLAPSLDALTHQDHDPEWDAWTSDAEAALIAREH